MTGSLGDNKKTNDGAGGDHKFGGGEVPLTRGLQLR